VCLCHAKHAYRDGLPVDFSWVTTDRLMECAKLSRGAVIKTRKSAIAKGWLTDIGPRKGHSQIHNYRLTIPHGDGPASTEPRLRNTEGQFVKKKTGPRHGPVPGRPAGQKVARPNRFTEGTGPPRGPESLTESLSPADELTVRLMADHHATAEEGSAVLAAAARDGIRSLPAWSRSDAGRRAGTAMSSIRFPAAARFATPRPSVPPCPYPGRSRLSWTPKHTPVSPNF
jgi:hypothetical protein